MANCNECLKHEGCFWKQDGGRACSRFQQKPMTNYDRILTFNSEEMAIWINMRYDQSCPDGKKWSAKECGSSFNKQCVECWQAWLDQPEDRQKWENMFEECEVLEECY